MKKIKTLLLFYITIGMSLLAQDSLKIDKYITVVGSVEIKEVADQAYLDFSVKGVGETLKESVKSAAKTTRDITEQLFAIGLKKNNIATSSFYSGENYIDRSFWTSDRDYQASISTKIKIENLEHIEDVLFLLSEYKVEHISQIMFVLKDELELRRRARKEAGLKAKEKADDIAGSLGVKVGKVIAIEELQPTQSRNIDNKTWVSRLNRFPNPFNPSLNGNFTAIDETKGNGFFAQTISVTSQVKVVFELE